MKLRYQFVPIFRDGNKSDMEKNACRLIYWSELQVELHKLGWIETSYTAISIENDMVNVNSMRDIPAGY